MPLRPQPWLLPLSWLYGVVQAWHGRRASRSEPQRLPVPVISVGNLVAGGTGKTPLTAWIVQELRELGLRPGVLARGYGRKGAETLNDEGRLLARRFPDLPQAQDPDRFAAGQRLLALRPCDVLVLDDGFQHRSLHRDVNLCLLDAHEPFAGGRLLPAGWLRERPTALARASAVVLSSAGNLTEEQRERSFATVRRYLPGERPIFVMQLEARACRFLPGGESLPATKALRGRRVVLVAGIARPERFLGLARTLGAEVEETHFVGDHRPISESRLATIERGANEKGAVILWTEKDEARHDFDEQSGPARIVLLGDVRFLGQTPDLTSLLPGSAN